MGQAALTVGNITSIFQMRKFGSSEITGSKVTLLVSGKGRIQIALCVSLTSLFHNVPPPPVRGLDLDQYGSTGA